MKHWDQALVRARKSLEYLANRDEEACRWFAEFILEQQEAAIEHSLKCDGVSVARQLTIVQARCTELLEEVRSLKAVRGAPQAPHR